MGIASLTECYSLWRSANHHKIQLAKLNSSSFGPVNEQRMDDLLDCEVQALSLMSEIPARNPTEALLKLYVWKRDAQLDPDHLSPSDALLLSAISDLERLLSAQTKANKPKTNAVA